MKAATGRRVEEIASAKLTSKGQVTIPIEVRRTLGLKTGDRLRFKRQNGSIKLERESDENPFEKWRGIGTGFRIKGKGRDAIVSYFREMRGHDDLD